MKEDQVIEKLIKEKVLDDKSIYVYASVKWGIGGVIGTINGLVLLSVYKDVLYIQKANIGWTTGKDLYSRYEKYPNLKFNLWGESKWRIC